MTPQQIDEARTQAEISRQVDRSFVSLDHEETEKLALEKHPPVFRRTEPVPPEIRNLAAKLVKLKQPKRKKHILP